MTTQIEATEATTALTTTNPTTAIEVSAAPTVAPPPADRQPTSKAVEAAGCLADLADKAYIAQREEATDTWIPTSIPVEPYPATVNESIQIGYKYKVGVIAATKLLKKAQPWRGSTGRRAQLLKDWVAAIAGVYNLEIPTFVFETDGESGDSGLSSYALNTHTITLRGKLSLLTTFHEMGHALGRGEAGTCRWSINLFRRVFPNQFEKLDAVGHTLRQHQA